MTNLDNLRENALADVAAASDEAALETARVALLGKKGLISAELKSLGAMSPDERMEFSPRINGLKNEVDLAIKAKKETLRRAALDQRLSEEWADITLPVAAGALAEGRVHPISQVWDEVTTIFGELGFSVAEGPEIETDDFNFTRLNFPPGHPARETQDTFFMPDNEAGEKMVLRTHTSPVQIRSMLNQKPPIRVICPGRTYRCDDDQTHTPMFHQVEGLLIDKESHMGHLKWVLSEFLRRFFEVDNVALRFRPSYFPFTEPSMEVDVGCERAQGKVKIGEGTDWLEILGCGMTHPRVLENCDLDPDIYQGFAWGMGIDRLAMLKYGMPDLRAFFDGDIRWLKHYGFSALDLPGQGQGGAR